MVKLLVGLIRVSTDKQERSGLGLEAQQEAIERYRAETGGQLIKTFMEVESGTHDDIESRPELVAAIAHAQRNDATLVIAKIDRLIRSTVVSAYLKKSGVRFVACDNPYANDLTINILVAVAEDEAKRISERTKAALRAYREGGHVSRRIREKYDGKVPPDVIAATAGKLGANLPQCRGHLTPESRIRGGRKSGARRKAKSADMYRPVVAKILAMWREGNSLVGIANLLQDENQVAGHATGKRIWYPMKVKRILDRHRTDSGSA